MSKKMKGPSKKVTPRELEVLELVVQGKASKEIGRMLGISFRTVSVHRDRLIKKLSASNTADLVRIAILRKFPIQYEKVKGGIYAAKGGTKISIKEEVRGK